MSKGSIKRNVYNTTVLKRLVQKYGYTRYYVTQCLNGNRDCETADVLKKDYSIMLNEVNRTLQNL
ncbi:MULTISPECIES: hypothetical protein [Flavobacterium]|uniref:Uncharacterized protein n=1 Tax=Flavobacterium columnare TaxID=996 RepID=A0AA94F459_9FLAO|nr:MULTISPECIES: hypothetical protein [Flavobacterium]MCH4828255.1 hypothetical protein [Flavobacterium columnare]MCH4834271.1 hypothetical protein [Flavobacterium columnare]QYS90687.1 hypothetical protein JJC04_11945 [Flavobacterium covae]